MKNVLKIFVATAVVGVLTVSAFAQGAGPAGGAKGQKGGAAGAPGKGGPGGGMRRGIGNWDTEILTKLKLTADQQKKVKALKESTQKKSDELRKSFMGGAKPGAGAPPAGGKPGGQRMQLTPEQREKFKSLTEGYMKGMKAILTPTQAAEYEKAMKEMRSKRGPGAPGGPGAAGRGAAGAAGKGKGKGTIKP